MKFFRRELLSRIAVVLTALLLASCASPERRTSGSPVDEATHAANGDITIALLGATGMVGGFILEQALEQGYQIRALARTPQKLAAFENRISVVPGDGRDQAAISELLRGSDVVLSALGPVRVDGAAANMLNTEATRLIIELMPRHNIDRYILVSGAAVTVPDDDRDLIGWLVQKSAAITLRSALVDKQAEYQLLEESTVQWTSVRCPVIKPEPYLNAPVASLDTPVSFSLRAGELARFMLQQIRAEEFIGKSPFLGSR